MPKAYSLDLRQRVAATWDRHEGTKPQLATRFDVSERFVYDLLAKRDQRGSLEPTPAATRRSHAAPAGAAVGTPSRNTVN